MRELMQIAAVVAAFCAAMFGFQFLPVAIGFIVGSIFLPARRRRSKPVGWITEPVADADPRDAEYRRLYERGTITTEQYIAAMETGNPELPLDARVYMAHDPPHRLDPETVAAARAIWHRRHA